MGVTAGGMFLWGGVMIGVEVFWGIEDFPSEIDVFKVVVTVGVYMLWEGGVTTGIYLL